MKRTLAVLVAVAAVGWLAVATRAKAGPATVTVTNEEVVEEVTDDVTPPVVQVALLLDTSSSMNGLIDQTKATLWKIVNELGRAKKGGVAPRLELALYEYGKSTVPGWIRQLTPFTTDLDLVSEQLFSLGTNGGSEHCGEVIQRSLKELDWSRDPDVLKLIYIAGNEPFTQGPVDWRKAVGHARELGIVVNTIHCGGKAEDWAEAARYGRGLYASIDHNQRNVDPSTPMDDRLAELSRELNTTYVPWGARGAAGAENQRKQDRNARGMSASTFVSRAVSKSSALYDNSKWDLVDALEKKQVKLDALKAEALPPEMRTLDEAGRRAYVENKKAERARLQKEIGALASERRAWLARERQKAGGPESLDSAMIRSVREQAAKLDFRFE